MEYWIDNEEMVCGNCKFYVQHYVWMEHEQRFRACNAGHCIEPRLKPRKPGTDGCVRFEKRE